MPSICVALLRGINVGGKNKLPMKDLAAIFAQAGCADVRTYIQSGNVIFTCNEAAMEKLPSLVTAAIAQRHGLKVPVVMRTLAEMDKLVRGNPFIAAGAPEHELHVMFLAAAPAPGNAAKLEPKRFSPDQFEWCGREIYLRLPNGMGKSKITNAYFDFKLATVSTARNWRTVNKLLEMMNGG